MTLQFTPNLLYSILIAVFVLISTLVILLLIKKNKKNGVLLLGICDSGKTALFSKLVYGKDSLTFASIKENSADYQTSGKKPRHLKIVDLPGHEKIRYQYIEQYKSKAGGVVFVVDSQSIKKEYKDVAEFLFNFLTDKQVIKSGIKILIACNKQDHMMAKGANVIQNLLEKELNTLRISRSGALEALDPSERKNKIVLGKEGREFQFSDLPLSVRFAECSVKDDLLDPVKVWLDNF